MTVEIERKFLLDALPGPEVLGPGTPLRQGYLAEEDATVVRLRTIGERRVVTIKAGRGVRRTEVEVPVSAEQADALWPHTAGRRVEKTRHRVALGELGELGDLVAEVDVYHGALTGVLTVEVEFPDAEAARTFSPPPWFGREVTDDPAWTNSSLARHGRP